MIDNPNRIRISARDRERMGMARLGVDVDRELSWSRGSALARLTGDPADLASVITESRRTVEMPVAAVNSASFAKPLRMLSEPPVVLE